MTRTLVSIQRILNLQPIEGADRIETATILGWKCVVPKGDFRIGDLVVYYEIDSFLPIRQEYEFLRQSSYRKFEDGREGFRIRTRKFKKQIAQGLVLRTNQVGGLLDGLQLEEGLDVTTLLGVMKYEPPMPSCLRGKALGTFPSFIPKTDETRVQLLQQVLDRHIGMPCYITEKIDGTSATYFLKDDHFGLCSRNLEVDPNDRTYFCRKCQWKENAAFLKCPRCAGTEIGETETAYIMIARELQIEARLRAFHDRTGIELALQGEIYGVGIGGNNLLVPNGYRFALFQIFDIKQCRYLDYIEFVALAKELGLEIVPVITDTFELLSSIDELVRLATGKSVITSSRWREGIVIRPLVETLDLGMSMSGGISTSSRLTFKVVNPEYLLVSDS